MPTRDMTNLSHVTAWSAAGAGRGGDTNNTGEAARNINDQNDNCPF